VKTYLVTKYSQTKPQTFGVTQAKKEGIRYGTRNVRSQYRAGSLVAAARDLARYKLNLVAVQEFRWDKGGTVRAGD
jgi:hypothetical protein